ncbi:MAG: glycosyltransferase family 2 protein [Saccharofermentanales bacterium]
MTDITGKSKVLLIIPAYNEAVNLPPLIDAIAGVCKSCVPLVINDRSTDDTVEVCRKLGCKIINLPVNLGIGGAVQTGLKYAQAKGYDFAIQVDGDGQHDPVYIPQMLEVLRDGANVCIGSRFLEFEGFQSTGIRRAGIKFYSGLLKILTGRRFTDPTSGFRAFDRKAIEHFCEDYPRDYPEPEAIVMLHRAGLEVVEIPVIMKSRGHGRSSINFTRSVYYFTKVTISILISRIARRR